MYVVRLGANGITYQNAKPCSECTKFLKKFFQGKIIYISDTGCNLEKVSTLKSNHLSFYQQKLLGFNTNTLDVDVDNDNDDDDDDS
uniref:Uncharacterized protein n=1 Tax=viral metagenome TaxID=1070528 RepID=A0A6C0E8Y0_9ZZZZ